MTASVGSAGFRSLRSVPFAFYRSGTSRGLFVLERDVPPKGADRDAVLCRLMGSGHPQQLEGFGGGIGPTSKAVVVGSHAEPNAVTYAFYQCEVANVKVDHSHGDCGNMLAAVAPFALERGLVLFGQSAGGAGRTEVRIHSLSTGALYVSEVCTAKAEDGQMAVVYTGDMAVPGVPSLAAPVELTTFGVAGSQTDKLLPTGRAVDSFDLGAGHGEVAVSVIDFARAMVILDADEILPKFGYTSIEQASLQRLKSDTELNAALERVRRVASLAMGVGDCAGKDSPKVALVTSCRSPEADSVCRLACRYWVTPERGEVHPTVALTAAQALAACCLVQGSVAARALGRAPTMDADDASVFTLEIAHPEGLFPVSVGTTSEVPVNLAASLFPAGVPISGKYATTVTPIAEGRAFV